MLNADLLSSPTSIDTLTYLQLYHLTLDFQNHCSRDRSNSPTFIRTFKEYNFNLSVPWFSSWAFNFFTMEPIYIGDKQASDVFIWFDCPACFYLWLFRAIVLP